MASCVGLPNEHYKARCIIKWERRYNMPNIEPLILNKILRGKTEGKDHLVRGNDVAIIIHFSQKGEWC